MGDAIVLAVLGIIVTAVIRFMYKSKKSGKCCGCSGNCGSCAATCESSLK